MDRIKLISLSALSLAALIAPIALAQEGGKKGLDRGKGRQDISLICHDIAKAQGFPICNTADLAACRLGASKEVAEACNQAFNQCLAFIVECVNDAKPEGD